MQLSRIGPIALEEPLGGSPDSNVLRGVHLERNMAMAVKLLPRHLVNRAMGGDTFATDVKTLQKLVHPNIARVYGGAMDNGQPYLAMELVRGESLRSLLDRRGRLPWETTVDVAAAVCEALDYAHRQGMVHQRLTPARVLLAEGGAVKLTGFDSKLADTDDVLGLRSPMSVAAYLAPEEFRGKQSAALPTCDLFSLGVIMYECLTGALPWQAGSPAELVQVRRDRPAPRVSSSVLECPVWLDVLVSRLLDVDRKNRLASADETRRAIVDAKRKVAEGMGAVQHAWSGKQGALAMGGDRQELAALRRKQVNRPRDASPFYERAWFLAACLAAVVGVGVWVMWPKSEDDLFAAARPLMASEDPVEWRRAKDQYLDDLVARFPDTKYADEIREFEIRFAMHRAVERAKNIDRFGRKPKTEAERLYAEGWRKERFGDLNLAWALYNDVLDETPKDPSIDEQAYERLARDGIARLKAEADRQRDSADVLQEKLDEADALVERGQTFQARDILDDIVSEYGEREESAAQVDAARERLQKLDARRGPGAGSN
jgi:hypothetical protein